MRIVFMGTPEFAVTTLEILHRSEFDVAGVVTSPDKPAGRGRKLRSSAVKDYALAHDIPLFQPVKLREDDFLSNLRKLNADVFVVVAFRMLPEVVWSMPTMGTINLHASLLPAYRGAAPINWAIINGEKSTGITTFFINEKIDTGSILLQQEIEISNDETAGQLHDKLKESGSKLMLETLRSLQKGDISAQEQDLSGDYPSAPKLNKENTRIKFDSNAGEVKDLVRGLSPQPGAYCELHQSGESIKVKIFHCGVVDTNNNMDIGEMETNNSTYLYIKCSDRCISVIELQMQGKRRMNIREFLNGYKFNERARFR